MISLGLANIRADRQREPLPDTSIAPMRADASLALAETAAWCSCDSSKNDKLRTPALGPSSLLEVPPIREIGIDASVKAKRYSYEQAINQIQRKRSELILDAGIRIADAAVAQSSGKLLLYEPMETVSDGAAAASSRDFFDVEDAPPWDTWFWCAGSTIFCWVPESLVSSAQAGIDANPVDCIRWGRWSKLPSLLEI